MITGWGANAQYYHIHYFRDSDGRPLCAVKGKRKGLATMSLKDWNPDHPNTCPKCKKILTRAFAGIGKT